MNLKNLKSENSELLVLERNIEELKSRKISKELDRAVLLYIKRIIELAELYDLEDYEELIEDIYLLQYEFLEEDGFTILSQEIIELFFKLQKLKSLTKASYEVEKVLERYK